MTDPHVIRPIGEDEFPGIAAVVEHAFNETGDLKANHAHELRRFEFDRSLAAFDGETIVGCAGSYAFQMTVPGAVRPVAGVTWVAVLPSHRRRGILRSLMRRQLNDLHARRDAIAVLYASETSIYGRYGYGIGSLMADARVRRGEGGLRPDVPADPALRIRIAEPATVRTELAKVYDTAVSSRPGLVARDDRWWDDAWYDPEYRRDRSTPLRCTVAEDDAGPRGYSLFSARPGSDGDDIPNGTIDTREVMATDPAAYAALWRDLLSRDLVAEVHGHNLPVDDPLLHMLADSRRARLRVRDGLWVRLVDVGHALAQRRYAGPADVVIEVTDELCPWNAGRWRLRTEGIGAAAEADCRRTSAPADVALPVCALGAVYLGGARLGALAGAGLVTELRPGTLQILSVAFSWDPAPWCPVIF